QPSIAAYADLQKSRLTFGRLGDSHARCVMRIVTRSAAGSEHQTVPKPPSHPYAPTLRPTSSVFVSTAVQNPHPRSLHHAGKKSGAVLCSIVRWSVVMASIADPDSTRSLPCMPLFSIIRPKA